MLVTATREGECFDGFRRVVDGKGVGRLARYQKVCLGAVAAIRPAPVRRPHSARGQLDLNAQPCPLHGSIVPDPRPVRHPTQRLLEAGLPDPPPKGLSAVSGACGLLDTGV